MSNKVCFMVLKRRKDIQCPVCFHYMVSGIPKDDSNDTHKPSAFISRSIPLEEPEFPEYACMCGTQDCQPSQKGIGCVMCNVRYESGSTLPPYPMKKVRYGACEVEECICPICVCRCTAGWKAKDHKLFLKTDFLSPLTEEFVTTLRKEKTTKTRQCNFLNAFVKTHMRQTKEAMTSSLHGQKQVAISNDTYDTDDNDDNSVDLDRISQTCVFDESRSRRSFNAPGRHWSKDNSTGKDFFIRVVMGNNIIK